MIRPFAPDLAPGLAASTAARPAPAISDEGAMMDDGPSVALFVVAVVVVSAVAAVALPVLIRRLSLRTAVPVMALVGPGLAVIGSLIGAGAMTLSGHDIWYSLVVTASAGVAAIVVGLRLARPVARDLDQVAGTVAAVAAGDRRVRTGIERPDEVGALAAAVDQLSRSLARAETERAAADQERRSVVGALSHDLRTPLASLLVSVDALEDGLGDTASHLRSMRSNVLALEAMVGDLFLLARADAGSLALCSEILDLAELIDESAEAVEPVASVSGIEVVPDVERALEVDGDHQALARVLRNLLDNAIRHSPPAGTVRIVDVSTPETARIEVVDEGDGFDESFLPRAFERFSQADDARSRPGGAGLGLAIAETLMAAHGGSIEVFPGPGGRVRIELPLVEGSAATDDVRPDTASDRTVGSASSLGSAARRWRSV